MRQARIPAPAWLALLAAGLGCAGTLGARASAVQQGVVGMGGRALRTCFGAPDYSDTLPEKRELWVYYRPLAAEAAEDVVIEAEISGTPVRRQGPRVVQGDVSVSSLPQDANDALERAVPPGSCRFVFGVGEGGIESLRASGRTPANLNGDERCLVKLERCLAVR